MKTKTIKALTRTLTALCLAGVSHFASAGIISFNPTPALGNVGDSILVDLVWTGSPGEYLGDWDVEIVLNSAIAALTGIVFDPDMGVDSLGLGLYDSALTAGGFYALGVSFDSPADLMTNQDSLGNTFRLATMTFEGVSNGQTALTFGQTTFGNENGDPIAPTLVPGQICVGPDGCTDVVPEPPTLALLSLVLAGFGWLRHKRT